MPPSVAVGQYHWLSIGRRVDAGVLLEAPGVDLFLPDHQVTDGAQVGDSIRVFIYADHDGAPQATTRTPAAVAGEIAWLKCVSVTPAGAYLAWGPPKDLFVPPTEQKERMVQGRHYVVAITLDRKEERLFGSSQLNRYFDYDVEDIGVGDEVELLVHDRNELGVHVVVNRRHRGLIHTADVHRPIALGETCAGFVRLVRPDHRLDIALTRTGVDAIQDAKDTILQALAAAGGWLALHDGSSPLEIEAALGISKKAFKRGVGGLYKAKRVTLEDGGIRLVPR